MELISRLRLPFGRSYKIQVVLEALAGFFVSINLFWACF